MKVSVSPDTDVYGTLIPKYFLLIDTSSWQEHYPSCGGEHQSPINLELAASKMIFSPKFDFNNYHQVSQEMITNNGHTRNEIYIT